MKNYLIIYNYDRFYETYGECFKAALIRFADYIGVNCALFEHALIGFDNDDVYFLIELFNKFFTYSVNVIYEIDRKIYDEEIKR